MLRTREVWPCVLFGGLITVYAAAGNCVLGQDGDDEEQTRKFKEELTRISKAAEPGDEVIALRDADLKAGRERTGTARKGQKLTLEQVQAQWFWVESNGAKGWIDSSLVMDARLFDWYSGFPDDERIFTSQGMRAKFKGFWFDVAGQRSAATFLDGRSMQFGGRSVSLPVVFVVGDETSCTLDKRGSRWLLSVTFMRLHNVGAFDRIPLAVDSLRRYGAVQPGDFVRIDVKQRRVYVNGQRRGPGT